MPSLRRGEALLPYEPSKAEPFDRKRAAHLARRAAFAASANELDWMVEQGLDKSFERLLNSEDEEKRFGEILSLVEGQLLDLSRSDGIQSWWLYRMVESRAPVREKMTLFWHDHFATSIRKSYRARWMLMQNSLFRSAGMGEFGKLLLAVSKDPAMLYWLDNRLNNKKRPNENFARELMELFSLGRDNYTEKDIAEVARAFSGWHLRGDRFFFNKGQHDNGKKTVFGKTGNWNGDDIIRLLLEKPECASHLVRKIWAFYIGPWQPSAELEDLAGRFREDSYHVGRLVERILRSRAFFSQASYRARITSPVEFVIGNVRRLGAKLQLASAGRTTASLGQALFAPPTVEGWEGEDGWLAAQWNLNRMNTGAMLSALRGGSGEPRFSAFAYAKAHELDTAQKAVEHFLDLFVDGVVPEPVRKRLLYYMDHYDPPRGKQHRGKKGDRVDRYKLDYRHVDAKIRGLVHLVMALPEAQVC